MHADAPSLETLFRAGRYALLTGWLDESPTRWRSAEVGDQLRLAHVLVHADRIDEAILIVKSNSARKEPSVKAHCELLLGLIAKREGAAEVSARHFQAAARAARDSHSDELEAWSQLHLFRLYAEQDSEPELLALVRETRRVVTRVGDSQIASYLHASVALREAQTGRLDEARRHLAISESLLEREPNACIQQLLHITRACVSSLDGDPSGALERIEAARALRTVTGASYQDPIIEVNQGHFEMVAGRLESASSRFLRASLHPRRLVRVAALDGLAQLYLTVNRLDECEKTLDALSSMLSERPSSFYSFRWVACTRVNLLLRKGEPQEAVREADEGIVRAAKVNDIPQLATLLLLKSQATAMLATDLASGAPLVRAVRVGALGFSDLQGSFYETCHRILSASGLKGAFFRDCAVRVWRTQGNIGAQLAACSFDGLQLELRDYCQEEVDQLLRTDNGKSSTVHTALSGLAIAFDLASQPSLSESVLQAVAASLGCLNVLTLTCEETTSTTRSRVVFDLAASESGQEAGALECILEADLIRIGQAVATLANARSDDRNRAALWPSDDTPDGDSLFVADEMRALAATARKVAPTSVPVLLTGETGTGKEILARAIHAASTRARAPFLPFNCAAGPRDMIDAQLFGHRRGAFTGALEHASGVVRAAAGGTLFLDEIGEAPLDVQPKLLRFLEAGEIHPLGEPLPLRVDVRVIAATNLDLDAAVASGRFREDLFYRLHIVRLHLPPLRERRVEIPLFAQHYLQRHARELGKGDLRLAEETMEYLLLYRWPGNVRQLANEMRRLATLAETDAVLMPEHLSPEIVAARRTVPASERTLDPNEVVVRLDQPLAAGTEHLERAMLLYALKRCGGRVEDTARRLGVSRKGLYLKRQRLGLDLPAPQAKSA